MALWYYLVKQRRRSEDEGELAKRLLQEASEATGEEAKRLLGKCCAQCYRLIARKPGDQFVLNLWGDALWRLAKHVSAEEADCLYKEAGEKFRLGMTPDVNGWAVGTNFATTLLERALLQHGEPGAALLRQACEVCERLASQNPRNIRQLAVWSDALRLLGMRTSGLEAGQFLALADAKISLAWEIKRPSSSLRYRLAVVRLQRAQRAAGTDGDQFLDQADTIFRTINREDPTYYPALADRACVLWERARRETGPKLDLMLAELQRECRSVPSECPRLAYMQHAWAILLCTCANRADAAESERLRREAKAKLLEADSLEPGSAAYYLAWVCAQLGEIDECREWLEKSGEPGNLVSCDSLATDPEWASVRDLPWFARLTAK
jgi:hypothetical protein